MATPEVSLEDPANRDILIKAGLFEADPSSVIGLSERISVDGGIDAGFKPIPYDTHQTTGEMVRCSVCAHRARHHSGFIVRNGTGELGLVGIECGESRLFGEGGWQEMVNRTVREQKAALYEHRWRPAKAAAEQACKALKRWAELAQSVDDQQAEFDDVFEELSARLRRELKEGTLSVQKETIQRRRDADGAERDYLQYVPVVVLRTSAAWFFRGRRFARRILTTEKKLSEAAKGLTSTASYAEIEQIRTTLRDVRDLVEECVKMLRDLKELESEDLWSTIATWAKGEGIKPKNLRFTRGQLRGYDNVWTYSYLVPEFDLPEMVKVAEQVQCGWPRL